MTKHLLRDLENLRKKVLLLGSMVEGAITKATAALLERRREPALDVIHGDDAIDEDEVAIEEDCLKVLALHQPVAVDLRNIVAVLKVNNELERMGDLAGNIAERAIELMDHPPVALPRDFTTMIGTVRTMVRDALEAMVRSDVVIARGILAADATVDRVHREMFREMQALIRKDPSNLEAPIKVLSISRYLERIADQCTNIAEDIVFLVEGEIVRHRRRR